MTDGTRIDRTTYAPFLLMETDGFCSLLLFDDRMPDKAAVFEAHGAGWTGNGYDWNALAQVVIAEQLPEAAGALACDPSAGTFSISGARAPLERLGASMARAFHDDSVLRDLLSRAVLD